jgi:DeoR family fructose operon transcriptional repressor
MFPEERKQRILAALHQKPTVRVNELGRALRVSTASIRRDLADLERVGLLKRAHGGAISARLATPEPSLAEKVDQYQTEKTAIARLAAALVQRGDTIFLDAGSTTRQIAHELRHHQGVTVVTNALNIAWELASSELELVVVGGQVRRGILSHVGPLAEQTIAAVHVDKLFLGANAVDIEKGITTPNLTEAQTKRVMVEHASEVILVADHSKFGRVTFSRICGLDRVHHVITDDRLPAHTADALTSLGIKLHRAPSNGSTEHDRP